MIIDKKVTFTLSEKEEFAFDLVSEILDEIVDTCENLCDDYSHRLYSTAATACEALNDFRGCIRANPFIEF